MSCTRLVSLSIVLLLAAGCGRGFRGGVVTTRIPHPARAGLVTPATVIAFRDERAERRAGMGPNTLVDRVTLTRADPRGVCARVALWAMHDDLHRGDFARYVFELEARDPAGIPRRVPTAQITLAGQWDTSEIGHQWRQVATGLRDQCVDRDMDGYCEAWETRVVTRPVREQAAIGVRYYAADLCFPGLIDERTTELALVMSYRRRSRRFVWQLDPNGRYSAPPPAASAPGVGPQPGTWDPEPATAGGDDVSSGGALSAIPLAIEQLPGGHPIDESELLRLLRARKPALQRCFDRVTEADPRLFSMRGWVLAQFTVGPSGVSNVAGTQNDFSPPIAACLQQYLESLPIPADPMRWTSRFEYGIRMEWTWAQHDAI